MGNSIVTDGTYFRCNEFIQIYELIFLQIEIKIKSVRLIYYSNIYCSK